MVESDNFLPLAVGGDDDLDRQQAVGIRDVVWSAARHRALDESTSAKQLFVQAITQYLNDPSFVERVWAATPEAAKYPQRIIRVDEDLWRAFTAQVRSESRRIFATADAALTVLLGVDL